MSVRLWEFRNEPAVDFSQPDNAAALRAAVAAVRAQCGREYPLQIGGETVATGDLLKSVNPSHPAEVVGLHHKATAALAGRAIELADAAFPAWARVPAEDRVAKLRRVSQILRRRKFEFDAWLVVEAGKSFAEAEADTCEAIDFCDYYALQMLKWAAPDPVAQLPGEKDELRYLPLGVGVIIPPWNFPLAILAGMSVAALVAGNTVVIKPSSDTPTIAVKFAEVLAEAGFPAGSFTLLVGGGGEIGDLLVDHLRTRFVSFTGSREVGLRINERAARPRAGQIWIKRVAAEMGGKDGIVVDAGADLAAAAQGVCVSAFGYQGQKCSACSRAIIVDSVYDEFVDKLLPLVAAIKVGPAEDPAYYMGPVINARSRESILDYIEVGKREGKLLAGGAVAEGDGYFIQPTVIGDIAGTARVFQEEIFGPVLTLTRARDFEHALELANATEYGLTGAVYSNDPAHVEAAKDRFFVGNLYINRKCTGAMVGCHPFGGFNMSGTDSKAGGPDYLLQFLQAKSIATKVG
jgi:1-pyrroline-5-carboxylate dehydrogenase